MSTQTHDQLRFGFRKVRANATALITYIEIKITIKIFLPVVLFVKIQISRNYVYFMVLFAPLSNDKRQRYTEPYSSDSSNNSFSCLGLRSVLCRFNSFRSRGPIWQEPKNSPKGTSGGDEKSLFTSGWCSSAPLVPLGLFFGSCQIGPLDLNE